MKKSIVGTIIMLLILIIAQTTSIGTVSEFRAFLSPDFNNQLYNKTAISYAVMTFQKLGYTNEMGTDTYTIANRATVMKYIGGTGNNYGLYVNCHGSVDVFGMINGVFNEYIYPKQITGYWHLVFIDSCYTYSTDTFANAFRTTGYSQRASMGWYKEIWNTASAAWWPWFYQFAGTQSLRTAALAAADKLKATDHNTPIRIYGDKDNWNGRAWR